MMRVAVFLFLCSCIIAASSCGSEQCLAREGTYTVAVTDQGGDCPADLVASFTMPTSPFTRMFTGDEECGVVAYSEAGVLAPGNCTYAFAGVRTITEGPITAEIQLTISCNDGSGCTENYRLDYVP